MPSKRSTRLLALAAAVLLTAGIAAVPVSGSLTVEGRYAVATMAFAAVLWVTGALPLPLTALCVPILLTVFGVYPDLGDAVAGFADPVVFLLLAGFVLAEALQGCGADRRVAYHVLAAVGTSGWFQRSSQIVRPTRMPFHSWITGSQDRSK